MTRTHSPIWGPQSQLCSDFLLLALVNQDVHWDGLQPWEESIALIWRIVPRERIQATWALLHKQGKDGTRDWQMDWCRFRSNVANIWVCCSEKPRYQNPGWTMHLSLIMNHELWVMSTWDHLGILPEKLKEESGEREFWVSLLKLLPFI